MTYPDNMAMTYVVNSSRDAGSAANQAEERKNVKHNYSVNNYLFSPLAFETMGAWGKEAKRMVSTLGKLLKERTGEPDLLNFYDNE